MGTIPTQRLNQAYNWIKNTIIQDKDDGTSEWPVKVVDICDDGDSTVTVTACYRNQESKYTENRDYALKLAQILGSPRIKEELGEQPLASFEKTSGIIFRKKMRWFVTNYRIILTDEIEGRIIQIPLKYVDISITDSHSVSERHGAIAGGATPGFIYAGMAFTQGQSTSRRIGHVSFIFNGQVLITIPDIIDPVGFKQLLYLIKKQIHGKME